LLYEKIKVRGTLLMDATNLRRWGWVKTFLQRFTTLIVALLSGTVLALFIFLFGLIVPEAIIFPLTFGIGAIFAAIGASWVGNRLATERTRSRLLPIVGISETTAVVVAVGLLALMLNHLPTPGFVIERSGMAPGRIVDVVLGMVFIALSASWATWRFRSSERRTGRDAAIMLGLVGLSILIFVATLYTASLFGLVGP
jgi:hypothetical protein